MSDAPIIILDEPTSALDARAESEVFLAVYRLDQRPDEHYHFSSIFNRANGRSHFGTSKRKYFRTGNSRRIIS